jgi:quinol monooxygenase YgiN
MPTHRFCDGGTNMKLRIAATAVLLAGLSIPSIAQTTGGAPAAGPAAAPGSATHKIVAIYRVKDYPTWYANYQAFAAQRAAAGLRNAQVFRSVSDPNTIVIYSEVDDLGKYAAFLNSPELKAEQQRSGIMGPPDVLTK